MTNEQTAPIIQRTPGVDEDDGGAYIAVWTELPSGETVGIRVCQGQDETISEERLVQAETWIKHTLHRRAVAARKGGAA